ncbi:hypothetical protein [Pseudofrankia sp. DC12]|uniref:phage shock envelope stress response protein PspM n=1 Tax=Pseudofrankia sp. DC12 TaxID=683315 RepID=UPI0005F787D9|nr:hypothetical protein [Pseudofrankia sp. DC12]
MRLEGWDWRRTRPKVPDAVGADLERRAAWRETRAAGRYVRRAHWTAGWWAAFGIVAGGVGAAADLSQWWLWLAVGVGAMINSGGWAVHAARYRLRNPELPLPAAPAPGVRALTGSAAAGPLRRGEAVITAFVALSRPLPPGPTADVVRDAMASAAEVVDGLRMRASRVIACEGAARAVTDPAGRAQITAAARALVGEMEAALRALDELVAAAAEVVGAGAAADGLPLATPGGPPPLAGSGLGMSPVDLDRLAAQAANLRGYAAGLRELAVGQPAAGLRGTWKPPQA